MPSTSSDQKKTVFDLARPVLSAAGFQGNAKAYALVVAVIVLAFSSQLWFGWQISRINEVNEAYKVTISRQDQTIAEMRRARDTTASLWQAANSLRNNLQEARNNVVRQFDFLAKEIPDGIVVTKVTRSDRRLVIDGMASSQERLAEIERRVAASNVFDANLPIRILYRGGPQAGHARFFTLAAWTAPLPAKDVPMPIIKQTKSEADTAGPTPTSDQDASKVFAYSRNKVAFLFWSISILMIAIAVCMVVRKKRAADQTRMQPAQGPSWLKRNSPLLAVVIVGFGVVATCWALVVEPAVEEYDNTVVNNLKLKEALFDKERAILRNLEPGRALLNAVRDKYQATGQSLNPTYPSNIADVMAAAARIGHIDIAELNVGTDEVKRASYAVKPITAAFVGTFDNLGRFVARLADNPGLGDISAYVLQPTAKSAGGKEMRLIFKANIEMVRLLSTDEAKLKGAKNGNEAREAR